MHIKAPLPSISLRRKEPLSDQSNLSIMIFSALTFAALAAIGAARQCTNLTIPLSLSARNGVFNLQAPASNIQITDFVLNLVRQSHNLTNELLNGVRATENPQ
jgi:hypothetical protein